MNLSYHTVFEKFDKQLSEVEKRVQGQRPSPNAALRPSTGSSAEEIALLTARLSRLQEDVNRLTRTVSEQKLTLECNDLQLQRNADDVLRHEREAAALRVAVADEKTRAAAATQENERLANEMRFLKAELDYRHSQTDELRAGSEETGELLKEKDEEIARLFSRVRALEDEREDLNACLKLASLRHRNLYAGDSTLHKHRRGPVQQFFSWLTKPMIVIGNIPE